MTVQHMQLNAITTCTQCTGYFALTLLPQKQVNSDAYNLQEVKSDVTIILTESIQKYFNDLNWHKSMAGQLTTLQLMSQTSKTFLFKFKSSMRTSLVFYHVAMVECDYETIHDLSSLITYSM